MWGTIRLGGAAYISQRANNALAGIVGNPSAVPALLRAGTKEIHNGLNCDQGR